MIRHGISSVDLPLHPGSCPPWLFVRMRKLSKEIVNAIVGQYSARVFLERIADPLWFQSLGCALGFDWHSSGLTTTVCAALREGLEEDLGLAIVGGKGKASLKTPAGIEERGEALGLSTGGMNKLVKASRLSAKVDSSCVQDGYELYHHVFFFDEKGNWSVVQQGMKEATRYARRYHWFNIENFTEAPEEDIIGLQESKVLNLVSEENDEARKISVDLIKDRPEHLRRYFTGQTTLFGEHYVLPRRHEILAEDLTEKDWRILETAYEYQPKNYEELVLLKGMGRKKLRALALLGKLLFGSSVDWKDPVKYSWSHGGKDGFPYPVDRQTYKNSIDFLRETVKQAKLGEEERVRCLRNLARLEVVRD